MIKKSKIKNLRPRRTRLWRKNSKFRNLIVAVLLVMTFLPLAASAQLSQFCDVTDGGGFIKVPCPLKNAPGPAGEETFGGLMLLILEIVLLVVGSVAVLFLIVGGFRYITAAGNEEQAESAKKMMTQAIVGVVVVVLSFAIITIIVDVLITGTP